MTDQITQQQNLRLSQSYFSALARGGLSAAINYSSNSNNTRTSSQTRRSQQLPMFVSPKNNEDQSQKKSNKQNFQVENRENNNQQILYQKRLLSLMSGNDLQPLEEEISKEEDDSIIVKVDVQKQQQSQRNSHQNTTNTYNLKPQTHRPRQNNKSNPYFQLSNQNNNSTSNNQMTNNQQNSQFSQGANDNNNNKQQISLKSESEQNLHSQASTQSLLKGNSMKTCSSYVSGDYNYNAGMEEAQLYESAQTEESENENQQLNLNEDRIQLVDSLQNNSTANNTTGSSANNSSNLNNQNQIYQDQMINDFNQQQKEKAKKIIESLKAQALKPNQNGNHNMPKVEKRLFDYQKKLEEKIDQQRKQKQQQEMQQLRPIPQICDKTNEILMKKSMLISQNNINPDFTQLSISNNNISNHFSPKPVSVSPNRLTNNAQIQGTNMFQPINLDKSSFQTQHQQIMFQNYQIEQKSYYEELKRKEELRQKMIEEKELQGFTGKPMINKKSQNIKRKVDDLIEWKDIQDKKREEELKKKAQQENQEIQQLQQLKVVNKQSEKLIEQKYKGQRNSEKVEDRLLRDASLRKKKQQRQPAKQIFYISDLEGRKSNTSRVRSQSNHTRQGGGGAQINLYQQQYSNIHSSNGNRDEQVKSRNRSPQYATATQQITLKENSVQQEIMNYKFDQRIFSQSVDAPNQYGAQYGSISPSNSNIYQYTNNTQTLSPHALSARSGFSTNPFNHSYFNNGISDQISQHQISQLSSQLPPQSQLSNVQTQQQQQLMIQQQQLINPMLQQVFYNNNIGGGSFDMNQFQNTQQPLTNNLSPQRLYQQMINNQNIRQSHIPNNHNSLMPVQQISYFDQSQFQNNSQLPATQVLHVSNISNHRASIESQGNPIDQIDSNINNMNAQYQQVYNQQNQSQLIQQPINHNPTLINHYQGQSYALNHGHLQQKLMQQQFIQHQQMMAQQNQYVQNTNIQSNQNINNYPLQKNHQQLQVIDQGIISPQNRSAFQEIQNFDRNSQSVKINQNQQQHQSQLHLKQNSVSSQQTNKTNSQKPKKAYESLFDKVQRMNVSQISSDFDSCHTSSTVPIVSATGQQMFYPPQSPANEQNNKIASAEFTCNPVIQKIQPEVQNISQSYKIPQNYDMPLQIQQSQNINQNKNQADPSQISYMGTIPPFGIHDNQDMYLQTQMSHPFAYTQQNPMYQSQLSGFNRTLLFQTTTNQDQIINKILDNSFIPSGNVNQSRRVSKGSDNPQLQTINTVNANNNNKSNDFNDVFKESENKLNNEFPIIHQTQHSRNTGENGQLLETDFIITNTSRGSDQNVVRNLNQVLSQESQAQMQNQQKGIRSQSETGNRQNRQNSRNNSPKKQSFTFQSTKDSASNSNLRAQNFMDRNNQWLENKKYRLEKAKAIHDQQQEKECPFKPQIKPLNIIPYDKNQNMQQSQRSRSLRGNSISQEKSGSFKSSTDTFDLRKQRVSVEREIQANDLIMDSEQTPEQKALQMLNQALSQKQLQNQNQSLQHQIYESNLARKRGQLLEEIDNLDISGQCDITTLSPDPKNQLVANESNFETSFLSSQEKDLYDQSHRNNSNSIGGLRAGQVKILNKKMINF